MPRSSSTRRKIGEVAVTSSSDAADLERDARVGSRRARWPRAPSATRARCARRRRTSRRRRPPGAHGERRRRLRASRTGTCSGPLNRGPAPVETPQRRVLERIIVPSRPSPTPRRASAPDRHDLSLDSGIGALSGRNQQATLRVARNLVGVREQVPHESTKAHILDRCGIEPLADASQLDAGRGRGRSGWSDGQRSLYRDARETERARPDGPCRQGWLDPAGKARQIACQGKTSTQTHQLPLATTINPRARVRKAAAQGVKRYERTFDHAQFRDRDARAANWPEVRPARRRRNPLRDGRQAHCLTTAALRS